MKYVIIFSLFFAITFCSKAQSDSLYLWPNKVPGEKSPKSAPVLTTVEDGSIRVIEITNPFMAVFKPDEEKTNHKAMIICPGGAYVRLAVHKEGYAVAEWLVKQGYTVFVLQYRVPNKSDGALQDLYRGIRLVRSQASHYDLDPDKIGAMGFSAGAHVVVRAGMGINSPEYPVQNEIDQLNYQPNCMVVIYPGYLDMGPNKSLSPGLVAKKETVPTFIFQSMDDHIVKSSFVLAEALQIAGAPVELHLVPEGGHGYGMYPGNKAAETWPTLLKFWLENNF